MASRLVRLLAESDPDDSRPILDLLLEILPRLKRPWNLLTPLIGTEDPDVAARGISLALDQIESGAMAWDRPLLRLLAERHAQPDGPFADEDLAARLDRILDQHYRRKGESRGRGLQRMLGEEKQDGLRRLAARLLDAREELPRPDLARRLLGDEAWRVLQPYLTYTRAGHQDLILLCGGGRTPAWVVDDFQRATEEHGEALVRRVVAELGWEKVCHGLRVESWVRLEWPGVAPLLVHPEEVGLFATDPPPVRGASCHLATARGGTATAGSGRGRGNDPVDRFRRINIAHAELLSEILETAPASRRKVERVIALMDGVVAAFHELFAPRAEQYAILPEVWRDLRGRATARLADQPEGRPLSADLVRLVLAFEDPRNLGEVRTIHGLKRLLHQEGLKLGFELVDTGQSPGQTVDLLLVPARGNSVPGPTLRYAELEAAAETRTDPWLPHPVRLAAEGIAWQLLHGVTAFPGLDVFVFGNEVHYYVTFRNHPAFLRVDYSPPQRGGMLDLEYYGVSNYEADLHPNLKLDAICAFFRAMQLEARTEGTRLFVRYDKERSHSLADLEEKVAALLRFCPFLMDVDWIAGSLQLPPRLRRQVIEAWAERFARAGVFPTHAILTADRRQILLERRPGPGGEQEITWSGKGPYRDCWSGETPAGLWPRFTAEARRLGLPTPTTEARELSGPLPLLAIHRHILDPVRRRLRSGQLRAVGGNLEPADPGLCRQEHETELLARLLAARDAKSGLILKQAVAMAPAVRYLEKFAPLHTTGFVGGLRVERGRITLRGGELRVFALRDEHSVIRLGVCTFEDRLLRRRPGPRARWRTNAWTDAEALWALLRSANYVGDSLAAAEPDPEAAVAELRGLAHLAGPGPAAGLISDPSILTGAAAAPGRATGRAVFGTAGREAEDLTGCLLVAREIRPTDSRYLMQVGGIISTGGAVLSHAALLAIQFGKPAMMVEAEWDASGPLPALVFKVTLYRTEEQALHGLHVCRRSVTAHTSGRLEEGDLCLLDTSGQQVRVLGQDADTLVLWQGFRLLTREQTARELARTPRQILEIRAQQLRARHQIKKSLHRVSGEAVADFAIEEIVLGDGLARLPVSERAEFVRELLDNPAVRDRVGPKLQELARNLADRCRTAAERYRVLTPTAACHFEVLGRRLRCLRLLASLQMVLDLQGQCGLDVQAGLIEVGYPGDAPAVKRLREMRKQLVRDLRRQGPLTRHLVRRLERLQQVLPGPVAEAGSLSEARASVQAADRETLRGLKASPVLTPDRCGLETHPLIGWKGANLAEMDRLAGPGAVPPWFAVSDAAFRLVQRQSLAGNPTVAQHLGPGDMTLGQAIDAVLAREGEDCAARARLIRRLWTEVTLPDKLVAQVARALRRLLPDPDRDPFVALRSSSCDEDTETSMQAGVYDTFLYVRGLKSVLEHLRLTWAGMWSERALYSRRQAGDIGRAPAAGVVVQRMVRSRVSGVMQTVNVAGGNLRELVISVGLGLGEGIVSGLVAADLITVVKDQGPDRDPVHFNYLTNDKPRQMVFDTRRGRGTHLVDTLYHQRLRPAIEYTELCEITRKALTLEAAYGYPLDMEFALEDERLWLLQARPITAILAEHQATLDHHQLREPPRLRPKTGD